MEPKKYSLRPQARSIGDSALTGAFRVFMAPGDMQSDGLIQGDYISIKSETTGLSGIAIVWRATDNIGSGYKSQGSPVLRVTEFLRGTYSFELKDRYFISKWTGELQHIESIAVANVTSEGESRQRASICQDELMFWVKVSLCECLLQYSFLGSLVLIFLFSQSRGHYRWRFIRSLSVPTCP
jgi:hypothetical protein